jgi:hypothetical protein
VINLTVHVGDISYADDSNIGILEPSSGSSYENVYDYFQESIAPVAAHVPYMVAPGNHDVSCKAIGDNGCPKQQRNFTAFRKRFIMPSAPSGALDKQGRPVENMWYSFDVGGVHFVSISTETDFPHAPTNPTTIIGGGAGGGFGDQLAWLRKDLNKARSVNSTRFIVVYGHRPWYSTVTADWPFLAPLRVQDAFEPLFREARVDLYICGHKHLYERTVSAFDGERNDNDGTVQVINGAAGNNEGLQSGKGVGGLIVSANYEDHGFGSIEVIGDRLRWRYWLSETGDVYDEFFLESRRTK